MINKYFKKTRAHFNDPLVYNGFFLLISAFVTTPLNFIFYKILVSLFSSDIVGILTSLIGLINWIGFLSRFGMNTGVRRFLPEIKNQSSIVNIASVIVSVAGFFVSLIILFLLGFFIEDYGFLIEEVFIVFLIVFINIATNVITIVEAILTAKRKAFILPIKQVLLNVLNIIFLIILSGLGVIGFFLAQSFAILGIIICAFLITPFLIEEYTYSIKVDYPLLKQIMKFSLVNCYLILIANYRILIPTLLVIFLSPESAAYYSIVMIAVNLLTRIPGSFSVSFMVESTYKPAEIRKQMFKTIGIIFSLLIPAIIAFLFFGTVFLSFFGLEYATEGYLLLSICVITTLPFAFTALYISSCYARNNVQIPALLDTFTSCGTIIGFLILIPSVGLISFGLSWLFFTLLGCLISFYKMHSLLKNPQVAS
ncbi:MAG: lipopolysaccharide biosynthesis protein [Promethearchaeota archaeon]